MGCKGICTSFDWTFRFERVTGQTSILCKFLRRAVRTLRTVIVGKFNGHSRDAFEKIVSGTSTCWPPPHGDERGGPSCDVKIPKAK